MLSLTVVRWIFNLFEHMINALKYIFPHSVFKPISPAMSPKLLLSNSYSHGRPSVSKGTEITIHQDGMTVILVTISV